MRRENALAVGLVAGLVLGALVTAGVFDASPSEPNSTNQTSSTPRAVGLQLTDIELGSGTLATAGKVLKIQYTIWLGDGTRIDSSNSFTFTMGKGEVIKGLDDGMVGMRVGGVRWLIVPPALAYGASGITATPGRSIPPNSTLVVVVSLLSVGP
jgi:FKBP-type peptidyl-prolyl cis-trans isomerase